MKKKLYLFFASSLLMFGCGANTENETTESTDDGYTITAKINGLDSQFVYLNHYENGQAAKIDSIFADESEFILKGKLDFPELFWLSFENLGGKIPFFAENSKIELRAETDSIEIATITGSDMHEKYTAFLNELENFDAELERIVEDYYAQEEGSAARDSVEQEYDLADQKRTDYLNETVHANAENPIGPYILWRYLLYLKELDELKEDFNAFSESIHECEYVQTLEDIIAKKEKVAVGQIAPEFTQNDTEGNPVNLNDFKGNYLLIDFWASWCGSCRRENPNVVKTYAEFHPKGFNILGVSLDDDEESWKKAIKDDNLEWTQVSDLQGWKNKVAELYVVQSIPHTVLLDPEGKIIAVDLRGEELTNKLNEIYK